MHGRRADDLRAGGLNGLIELVTVLAVIVADDEPGNLPVRCRFPPLLSRPDLLRRTRDTNMHDPTGSQLDDEIQIQMPEEHIRDRQEVEGVDISSVRLDERRPALARARLRSQPMQVFLDAAFGDADPDFEQLAADSFSTSQKIVCCHAPDQIDCGLWQAQTRLPCSGLPPPKQPEAFATPAQQRVGFDDQMRLSPVAQLAGPEQ